MCKKHLGKAKLCTILTYIIPVLILLIAVAPAAAGGGGGGGVAPIKKPIPVDSDPVVDEEIVPKECFYFIEETYYEDTGEIISQTEL